MRLLVLVLWGGLCYHAPLGNDGEVWLSRRQRIRDGAHRLRGPSKADGQSSLHQPRPERLSCKLPGFLGRQAPGSKARRKRRFGDWESHVNRVALWRHLDGRQAAALSREAVCPTQRGQSGYVGHNIRRPSKVVPRKLIRPCSQSRAGAVSFCPSSRETANGSAGASGRREQAAKPCACKSLALVGSGGRMLRWGVRSPRGPVHRLDAMLGGICLPCGPSCPGRSPYTCAGMPAARRAPRLR